MHSPQQDNRVASVHLENEGGDEGHTEVDVASRKGLIGVGQELNVLHVHEPLGPQHLLGHILRRDADSRDLDQSNPRGFGGQLGGGRPGCQAEQSATAGQRETTEERPPGDHAFNSFFSSLRKRQSALWVMIFCGLLLIIPASFRRSA